MNERKWVTTVGGPIVILPVAAAKNWSGAFSRKSIEAQKIVFVPEDDFLNPLETDYGKACEIEDYIGTFDFNGDKAIVLGDGPNSTTCLEIGDKEILIVRWIYAENDESVDFYLRSDKIKKLTDWVWNETIYVKHADYVMFDSAEPGFEILENEALYFKLETSEYTIKTCEFKPDDETFLVLHKFEKARLTDERP